MRPFIRLSLLGVVLAATAACATHSANIADLKYNTGRYYNRTVSVEGVVRDAWNVPFAPVRAYRIADASGDVTVVSQSGHVPPPGARVEVIGRVEDVATFGDRAIGLHIREESVRVYR